MTRLHHRIALVSGGAQGIGAAIAAAFVAEGARVWLTDIDTERGEATAGALGEAARFRRLDVRDEADWVRVTDDIVTSEGRLDILVNNAGIIGLADGAPQDPEHAELGTVHDVFRTNVDGVFLGCKHALRAMRPAGTGAIVNLASRSGQIGVPRAAAYAASKAAVASLTRSVALYCAEEGLRIRCNAIVPGAVLTPMWEPMLGAGPAREANLAALVADVPMRRFGRPEEVAAVAVMLAGDEAAYMTGAEVAVDGGLLAGTVAAPEPARSSP